MNIDSFRADTYLAGTHKCAHGNFGCNFVDINVRKDDTGVITAELETVSQQKTGTKKK